MRAMSNQRHSYTDHHFYTPAGGSIGSMWDVHWRPSQKKKMSINSDNSIPHSTSWILLVFRNVYLQHSPIYKERLLHLIYDACVSTFTIIILVPIIPFAPLTPREALVTAICGLSLIGWNGAHAWHTISLLSLLKNVPDQITSRFVSQSSIEPMAPTYKL